MYLEFLRDGVANKRRRALLEQEVQVAEGLVRLASLDLANLQRLGSLALDGRELGVDLIAVLVELIRIKRGDANRVDYDLCI